MSLDADAPSPTVLAGRYHLERRVAQGGMAEVWLATDTALSRQVAVKLLKPQLAADPVVAERFRREAIAVASVTHPNIVAVYDAVDDGGRQAVVMQYVQGKTLRQLLDEQGTLSPELTVHIGSALAAALDAAHSAGLVHRDVKPGNVLVTPEGRVQLADFGIAKALSSNDDLTSDNVMMGTAKYLSPEQVRGRRLDGRADLYSLGLVLYECLAGKVPFLGETDADTALARLQRDATDLTRLRPTLPRNLATVVHRLIEREPEHRYPTGAAVRTALSTALTPTGPDRPGRPVAATQRTVDLYDDEAYGAVPEADMDATVASTHLDPILDRTPAAPVRSAQPSRPSLQQRWAPSLVVVGVLLLLALIVGLVIWSSIGSDSPNATVDNTQAAPSGDARPAGVATESEQPESDVTAGIASVRTFDPDGTDDEENDDEARFAVDGDPTTAWHTVCYSSEYFGGKRGIGLIVTFNAPTEGMVTIDLASAPWILKVYAVNGEVPSDLEGWGDPVEEDFGADMESVTLDLSGRSTTSVLVMLKQGSPSEACTTDNPHRGAIAEITLGDAA